MRSGWGRGAHLEKGGEGPDSLPKPKRPLVPLPQMKTLPSELSTQAWKAPLAISLILGSRSTCQGCVCECAFGVRGMCMRVEAQGYPSL